MDLPLPFVNLKLKICVLRCSSAFFITVGVLEHLDLSHNMLSGSIPSSFTYFEDTFVRLGGNPNLL